MPNRLGFSLIFAVESAIFRFWRPPLRMMLLGWNHASVGFRKGHSNLPLYQVDPKTCLLRFSTQK